MLSRRVWIPVVLVLSAAAVVVGVVARRGGSEVSWRTEPLQRGTIRQQVSATGTLKAVTTVQVGSQVTGTISFLYADFNDVVHKGQVLAQLDPTFLKAQVAQNRAELERARVQQRQAERDSARVFALGRQSLASQADLDASQTAIDAARASVSSAEAALDRAITNLRYATISSPIDGVVISRDVDVGQTVAASLSAPTLFTIANDLTQMQLEAAVDEADIGQVRAGQIASFTVDSYPDLKFQGVVHQVRLQPETIQNVVTYTVVILVQNSDLRLLPGMTANVSIIIDEAPDVLRVPVAALRFQPRENGKPARAGDRTAMASGRAGSGSGRRQAEPAASGQAAAGDLPSSPSPRERLFVLSSDGRPRRVPVQTGLSDGTFTAVASDSLREGDLVIVGMGQAGASSARPEGTVNPFGPRFPGGGRR